MLACCRLLLAAVKCSFQVKAGFKENFFEIYIAIINKKRNNIFIVCLKCYLVEEFEDA
jgi:hypothetical protein